MNLGSGGTQPQHPPGILRWVGGGAGGEADSHGTQRIPCTPLVLGISCFETADHVGPNMSFCNSMLFLLQAFRHPAVWAPTCALHAHNVCFLLQASVPPVSPLHLFHLRASSPDTSSGWMGGTCYSLRGARNGTGDPHFNQSFASPGVCYLLQAPLYMALRALTTLCNSPIIVLCRLQGT